MPGHHVVEVIGTEPEHRFGLFKAFHSGEKLTRACSRQVCQFVRGVSGRIDLGGPSNVAALLKNGADHRQGRLMPGIEV